MRKGRFIVIYGIAGAGKTTQINLLYKWFKERGNNVITTKEPSTGEIGMLIRKAVRGEVNVSRKSLVYLFVADRIDHQEKVIIPALKEGKIVLSERYYLDTIVYQSLEGYPLKFLRTINRYIIKPTVSIYLDVPVETAINRMKRAGEKLHLYEEKDFLEKLRERYLKVINYFNKRKLDKIHIVDGTKDVKRVFEEIKRIVLKHM